MKAILYVLLERRALSRELNEVSDDHQKKGRDNDMHDSRTLAWKRERQ